MYVESRWPVTARALGLKAGEVLITPIIAMPTLYDQERFCQQILYGVA